MNATASEVESVSIEWCSNSRRAVEMVPCRKVEEANTLFHTYVERLHGFRKHDAKSLEHVFMPEVIFVVYVRLHLAILDYN